MTTAAARAVVALLLVLILGTIFNANGSFFKLATQRDTLREISDYGILACGMTLVIISGGIDLSVGSVLALVGVCFSIMSIHWGLSPWIAIPLSLLIGAGMGLISGTLIAWFGIQPFIATLAMMVFARGLTEYSSGDMQVSTAIANADGTYHYVPIPMIFRLINASIFGGYLSVVTVILAVCAVVAWLALARHRWGRYLFAIGGNEEAARLSGVPVARAKITAYVASGMFAAVAGICQAAQEQQGDPRAGIGSELTAIAIVVIGGTSLMGGRGGMGLTILGMLTIGYMEKILSLNAVPDAGRSMLTGIIIVAAVLAQRRRR
ncbi:MAG: ABC transporter permease [Phycisphaerae bacterium]|nr:ABC transporter permease [Phycisphaerae bacterium]